MDSKRIGAARSRVYIIVTSIAALLDTVSATGLREYIAAEARKHIGERATIVGKVDCIDHGRRHTDVLIGGCDLQKTLLWVVVFDEVSGSELDCGQLRGVTIAVTGKIESSGGTPQITINSASQIVPRTPLNPDYFSSAMEKQSQGDFDGAIADLDRAVELTHEASIYVQRAEVKQKKGDLDGAISDYDQLLEHYPNEGVYFLNRGRLKRKNSDYAGVVADSSRAIELLTRYYSSHPNDHSTFILAQAYSERGEAKEAMGDSAGGVTDYENAVKNDRAPIYKEKLRTAKSEAAAKKLAITQPTAQSAQNEQSFNKSEVSPKSIAEAFVQAHSGANVDAVAALYADRVDHTNSGVISNAAVRAQAKEYFARWPLRQWSLVGPVNTISLGATKQKVIFSATYDVSDPQTNKHTSGIAKETLILATDASGAMKIVSQKEQTNKRSSGQSGSQPISTEVVDIPAPQAQFGIKAGNVKVTFSDGHTEVWTHSGDCHNAKVSPKGNVGWIRVGKRETLSPSGKTIALDNDSLVVHFLDGTTKKFQPFGENHFIPDWRFADDDKAVILRSGGYHGPASYVQYDLASGKVIDSRGNGYTPYAELPAWAKPLADPNE